MHPVRQGIPAEHAPGEAFEMQSDTQGQKVRRRDHLDRAQIAGGYFFPTAFCSCNGTTSRPLCLIASNSSLIANRLTSLRRFLFAATNGLLAFLVFEKSLSLNGSSGFLVR